MSAGYFPTLFFTYIVITQAGAEKILDPAGKQLVLACPDSEGSEKLLWLKDDKVIAEQNSSELVLVNQEESGGNPLNINFTENFDIYIAKSHIENSGIYVCVNVRNDSSEDILAKYEVFLQDIPSKLPAAPTLRATAALSLNIEWPHSPQNNHTPVDEYIILVRYANDNGKDWHTVTELHVPGDQNSTKAIGLLPYTEYVCAVRASNAQGQSELSDVSEAVRTLSAPPSTDAKPVITSYTAFHREIYIKFRPPRKGLNGPLLGYVLGIRETDIDKNGKNMASEYKPNLTDYTFRNLKPNKYYLISVAAITGGEDDESHETTAVIMALQTEPDVPNTPVVSFNGNITQYSASIKWRPPSEPNGKILGYTVCYWLQNDHNLTWNVTVPHPPNLYSGQEIPYEIINLEPNTVYEFQVDAINEVGHSKPSNITIFTTEWPLPSAPTITNMTIINATMVKIDFERPKLHYENINQYNIQYKYGDFVNEMKWMGEDMTKKLQEVIISGLMPDTEYAIMLAGVTQSRFYDPKYFIGNYSVPRVVRTPKTELYHLGPSVTGGVIAGIVVTSILLVLAIIGFIFMRWYVKRHYHFVPDQDSTTVQPTVISLPDSFANAILTEPLNIQRAAIKVEDFGQHVLALHADSDLGYSQEYEELHRSTRPDLTVAASTDSDNRQKNRYINILAYDHSRVLLRQIQNKPKSDYINANFVDGYETKNAYIASQGPLPNTFDDFWRMVWEQNSAVICMITNLMERGRRKCDQYWPSDGEHTYGNMQVKLINTYIMAHYSIRVFTLKNVKVKKKGSGERLVYQYHYTDWPDHGVPDFTLPVLTYVRRSAQASPESAGPIIIHCSAGVGRTGTYIMLDTMIKQIKDKNSLNVYGFLSRIRQQRNFLVQTEDQYIFIHDALMEFILSGGETEIKDSNIPRYLDELVAPCKSGAGDTDTVLDKQYQLITSFKPKDFHLNSALLEVNKVKNRGDILPIEDYRVKLPMQPGEEGSDYINASYIQGFYKNDEYVITQHPLPSTVTDFWRMVWDQNSMTVVLLSPVSDEEQCPKFWPKKEETVEYGAFKVTFTGEEEKNKYVVHSFLMESTQDDYECITKIFSTTSWPDEEAPLHVMFEFIGEVKAWHKEHEDNEGPVIVVDKFGGPTAARFIALSTLEDQLHNEGSVDVYMVGRLYHLKRPNLFPEKEDYHILYKALNSIVEDSTLPGDRDSGIANCNNYHSTLPSHGHSNSNGVKKETRQESTL